MSCTASKSPTREGRELDGPVTGQQSSPVAESGESTAREPFAGACEAKTDEELDRLAPQAPIIEDGSNVSIVEGTQSENGSSESILNDTEDVERHLRKRHAPHTTAIKEPEGATVDVADGEGASYILDSGGDQTSGLQPRPVKFPRTAPAPTNGEAVTTEATKAVKNQDEELQLEKPGVSVALPKDCHNTCSHEGVLNGSSSVEASGEKSHPPSTNPSEIYQSAWILAPMVRISTLPFRLECLKYGADIVYSEEIVDRKLIDSKRYINKDFGTVEYIHKNDRRCVFSTCDLEKGKVVLQLGTADPARALQAATIAMQDISAVDVNMGCPKSFSVKGGMGAALLQTPDLAMDILKTLTRNLTCPVTCKIRLLETMEETVDFARKCESTGITAIAVHARILKSALNIPLIANGDFLSAEDATRFQAVLCGAPYQSIKFTLQEMTARDSDANLKRDLVAANSTAKVCTVFGLDQFYNSIDHVPHANTLNYYKFIDLE
ncbi:dihydrouridine synthase domain-containing protein, putative [Eimeria maxima]|uniref:Dihydrouridine synthase domain-containing protein, putative n=1 Tax=Eimeria maxima TaxID=5804 RepID=U6M9B8_EIMMA|nr:dihydrouridine synthase domain-containing protein, putative [Eimeria maxima]CDJ60606.1 dihydrouridine synthase domain-containing protein, putative [Eimeria maxima]